MNFCLSLAYGGDSVELNRDNMKKILGIIAFTVLLYAAFQRWEMIAAGLQTLFGYVFPFVRRTPLGSCEFQPCERGLSRGGGCECLGSAACKEGAGKKAGRTASHPPTMKIGEWNNAGKHNR